MPSICKAAVPSSTVTRTSDVHKGLIGSNLSACLARPFSRPTARVAVSRRRSRKGACSRWAERWTPTAAAPQAIPIRTDRSPPGCVGPRRIEAVAWTARYCDRPWSRTVRRVEHGHSGYVLGKHPHMGIHTWASRKIVPERGREGWRDGEMEREREGVQRRSTVHAPFGPTREDAGRLAAEARHRNRASRTPLAKLAEAPDGWVWTEWRRFVEACIPYICKTTLELKHFLMLRVNRSQVSWLHAPRRTSYEPMATRMNTFEWSNMLACRQML